MTSEISKILKYWTIAILLFAGIVLMTHTPPGRLFFDFHNLSIDKILHILMYGLVSLFVFLGISPGYRCWKWVIVLFVLLALAGAEEITQRYTGQTASWGDFLADALGIFGVFINFIHHKLEKQEAQHINKMP